MLKKTILITLFLSFNKSYSKGGLLNKLKKGLKNTVDFFNKDNCEIQLKISNIDEYKNYDKLDKSINFENLKSIVIKIHQKDKEENVKNNILKELKKYLNVNTEDIEIIYGYGKFDSFTIKNLIITETIEEIGKLRNDLSCEINEKNKDNYKENFNKFENKVKELENNKFYSEYHETLGQEVENINKKIIDFSSQDLTEEQKKIKKNIEEDIDNEFAFIFKINSFEGLEDDEKKKIIEKVNNILFKNGFEEMCEEILKKYKIDDILKPFIKKYKDDKFTAIKNHLDKFLTKIKFELDKNKNLKDKYSRILNDINKEYQKGKFETIYHRHIFDIFKDAFKLEETEEIKFYCKTEDGRDEIITNEENNDFFIKNEINTIYVEFPESFYINNEDDYDEETEEVEENQGKGDKKETEENKDGKAKKGCCSQENDSKSKKKGCCGK